MHFAFGDTWIFQHFLNWRNSLFEHWKTQFFKFGSGNSHGEILRICQWIDFNGSLMRTWKNSLCFFALSSESSESSSIIFNIYLVFFIEFIHTIVNQFVVKVLSTEMSISCSCLDLENTSVESKKRNIKSSSSKIEDQHISLSFCLLVKTVCNRCSCRLINNSQHIESWNYSRIFSGLSLTIIKIGWNSNDCVFNCLSKVGLSGFFHFGKDHGWDLLRVKLFCFSFEFDHYLRLVISSSLHFEGPVLHILLNHWISKLPSDQSFGIEDGIVGILGHLIFGWVSDESFCFCEGNIRWGGSVALIIGDDLNPIILPDSYTRVGGAQVDSNSFLWLLFITHLVVFVVNYVMLIGGVFNGLIYSRYL